MFVSYVEYSDQLNISAVLPSHENALYKIFNDTTYLRSRNWITQPISLPKNGATGNGQSSSSSRALWSFIDACPFTCIEESNRVIFAGFVHGNNHKNREATLFLYIEPGFRDVQSVASNIIEKIVESVLRFLVDHAFAEMGMHRVSLSIVAYDNPRGRNAIDSVGFVQEGRKPKAHWTNGTWHDVIEFGIVQDDWEEKKKKKKQGAST